MYAEQDQFTARDRKLLAARTVHDQRKIEDAVPVDERLTLVKYYESREIFRFHAAEVGEWVFDVRGIKDAILAGKIPAQMMRMPQVPEEFYQHVLHNNGVEEERIARLTAKALRCPGVMVHWPDGHSTLIDGNHRLCKRWRLGLYDFRFLIAPIAACAAFVCRPGEERQMFAAQEIPGFTTLHTEVITL